MDFIDESFGAQTTPVTLDDLVATPIAPSLIPKGAIRNRAATTALLTSEPDKAVENYQLLMKEGEEGNSAVYDQLKGSILENTAKADMQGIMSVLGDSSVSLEEKRRVVSGVKNSQFLKDSGTILHTNSLAKPSQGENTYQEASRISSSDLIREVYDARIQRQGLVNAHAANLESVSIGTLGDMIALDILPGGTALNAMSVQQAMKKAAGEKMSLWDTIKATVAPGQSKKEAYDRLKNFPPAKQEALTKAFLEEINSHQGTVFGADSQFAQARIAQEAFGSGGYTSSDAWLDTVANLADVVGVGFLIRGTKTAKVTKATEQATTAEEKAFKSGEATPTKSPEQTIVDDIDRIERNSVIRKENPSSPANIVQQANPEQARNIHTIIAKSDTDATAEALYGTTKNQAIINDVFPQAATEIGTVTSKVADIDRNLRKELQIDETLIHTIHDSGAIYYSDAEKAAARANVVNDFHAAEGLTINDAESAFSVQGGRIRIDAMYGTSEGGFLTAQDAVTQAKFALRGSGIIDEDITVMVKSGLDYVPTTVAESLGKEGSYKIRISTFHSIDPTDITKTDDLGKTVSALEGTTVKRNWLDSVGMLTSQNRGSAARWFMDPSSMIDTRYTGAAIVATDQTSRLEKLLFTIASEFSDQFVKLNRASRARVDDYIKESNYKRIKYDEVDLKFSRGFNDAEISTLRSWKKVWDNNYYLENYDVVKSLSSGGYQLFKNASTELYAKPITKNQNIGWFYDPSVGDVVRHGKGEGDILYAAGGTYAQLRRPTTFNGIEVEHMIIRNTPTEYSRKFRDTDMVLPYIDGYHTGYYKKNAKFVDEITERDSKGVATRHKTIAVSGDTASATAFAKQQAASSGKNVSDFVVRGDVNGLRRGSDEYWDLNSASGRVSQRHRGKLLEDAHGVNRIGDGSYVLNPVDSAIRAARSISGRTVTRPMLEAAKARYIKQHAGVLPPNKYGGRDYPNKITDINQKGEFGSKELRDARSDYEYINYLENGYVNSMDEMFKQFFNALASVAGEISKKVPAKATKAVAAVERGLLAVSDVAVTGVVKGAVFTNTIVSNVFRQWIVQPHQILRTIAYNPEGWQNGGVLNLVSGFVARRAGAKDYQGLAVKGSDSRTVFGFQPKQMNLDDFDEFIIKSGLLDSVDKHNLVRGTLLNAADSTNKVVNKVAKYTTTPARVIGFDTGEMANLVGHAAAVYERRVRLGGDMKNLAQRDEAWAEIRDISGTMNFAGDMPYNQTSPAVLLQFAQVPQKMFLQMTNRRIDPAVRARMAAFDWVVWGSPIPIVAEMMGYDILPDNPFQKEAFMWGLESAMLNHTLSKLADRKVDIDISSLAPSDLSGWFRTFHALYTGGVEKAIITSPAGQQFLKEGGRVQTAISHTLRFFGASPEIDETPETALQVAKEWAKVLSGVSNSTKAWGILETHKLVDKSGQVVVEGLGTIEAIAQLFGMPPTAARDYWNTLEELQRDPKKHKEAFMKDYAAIVQYYTSTTGGDITDNAWKDKVVGAAMRRWKNDPVAMEYFNQQFGKDVLDPTSKISRLFLKRIEIGVGYSGGLGDIIEKAPVPESEKIKMRQIKKNLEDAMVKDNEGNK